VGQWVQDIAANYNSADPLRGGRACCKQ